MLTNFKVYNIKKTSIQREVPLDKVIAYTHCEDPKNYGFIIHFHQDYDYKFTSLSKYGAGFATTIMNALQYAFARNQGYNLPIY